MPEGLSVSGLTVGYRVGATTLRALDDVSFAVPGGHRLAIVGESGSGKSTLGLALMGLLPRNAAVSVDAVQIGPLTIDLGNERALRTLRGRTMSMIFQDARSSLDPVRTIGFQIAEPVKAHAVVPGREIRGEVERLLQQVEIPHPALRARQYPHELSGGMRQRAMIATALAGNPRVLIADEPTSALDVTTQATVIDLIRRLAETAEMTTILITHDLALVAEFAESVLVLYAGKVVEFGSVAQVYGHPAHPYTQALLASIPRLGGQRRRMLASIPGTLPDLTKRSPGCAFEPRCARGRGVDICRSVEPLLVSVHGDGSARCHFAGQTATQLSTASLSGEVPDTSSDLTDHATPVAGVPSTASGAPHLELRSIEKTFSRKSMVRGRSSRTRAVGGVDLTIAEGESLGIVGESGSGKTTLARVIVGLERADAGEMLIRDDTGEQRKATVLPRRYAQMVFQDPGDSLNPQMAVGDIVSEPLVLRDGGRPRRYRADVQRLLVDVGLRADMATRRPSELSGGQRQRVAIARALSTQPKIIIADEAVASLDMSARGQILNLLGRLQRERRFALLYISHDLSLVRHVCDRVAVMYAGRVVEIASADELFSNPRHPYTQALISAVPNPQPNAREGPPRVLLRGDAPDTSLPIVGCPFRSRCDMAEERCEIETPLLYGAAAAQGSGHGAACHFSDRAAARFALQSAIEDAPCATGSSTSTA